MSAILVLGRKEAYELVLSVRGISWLLVTATALSVFCLLLVGSTELSLLDNAQVVYDLAGITLGLGSLYALVIGNDAIGGERERGSLIPLLLTPMHPSELVMAKAIGVVSAWLLSFVLALPYFWAIGSTGQNLADAIVAEAILGTPVVLGFGFLGIGLGSVVINQRAGIIFSLIILLIMASPLMLDPSVRQSSIGSGFDAVNPFSAAINAFDAVVIDSEATGAQGLRIALTLVWLALSFGFALWSVGRLRPDGGSR